MTDDERGLVLAWFGGMGVNIYNMLGTEVSYYIMGGAERPSVHEAKESMRETIEEGSYP
tara:strand:- start:52 stop:228 length:177 start_codon:yes stop_codon:yes gene_type:complete